MLVLEAGMPRAGTGWHYNLIHDLVVAAGGHDARRIRRRYGLSPILTEVNCNIGALTKKRLIPVMVPAWLGNDFVIKAHAGPEPFALRQIQRDRIRVIYIYRDPRAALLSAYEAGGRSRTANRNNAFARIKDIDDAIAFMLEYVHIWEQWMACDEALHTRYEDLLSDYEKEVERHLMFLEITKDTPGIDKVIHSYRPGRATKEDKGLHFRVGQPERFRTALTEAQLAACAVAFSPYLERMGYQL
jgi:hypothetical protein